MEQVIDLFSQMPGGGLIVAVAGVLIGLTLWVVGHRVLRPGFSLIGVIFGAGVGWIAAAFIPFEVPAWLPAIFVGIVFGILAWVSFRLTMAVALAMVFGLAAPLGVWSWAQYKGVAAFDVPPPRESPDTLELPLEATEGLPDDLVRDLTTDPNRLLEELQKSNLDLYEEIRKRLDEWLPKPPGENTPDGEGEPGTSETGESGSSGSANPLPAEPPAWVKESERVIRESIEKIIETWQNQPPGVRWSMSVSAISGILFGLLLGLAAPAAGAGLVTALTGSLLWMACGWVLAVRFGAENWPFVPQSSATWVIAWAAISIIGLGIQWTLPHKRADKTN